MHSKTDLYKFLKRILLFVEVDFQLNENLRDMQRKEENEEELLNNLADEIEEMRGNKQMEKSTKELADERRKLDEVGKELKYENS